MASTPDPATPSESEPLPTPSVPGIGLWNDSDIRAAKGSARAGEGAPAMTDSAGEPLSTIGHIGRYALKYRIGEGGLGTVYAAHDPLLSRLIAIKTLNLEISAEQRPAFNAMFLNEARAAASLSHPNIVTVFDAGVSDDNAYIAMELLKGRDLRQLRLGGWRPTPAQAARKPAKPPYEGCVAVTKQEYDSARRQNMLRTRFSQYLRTGIVGRRHYWYCR